MKKDNTKKKKYTIVSDIDKSGVLNKIEEYVREGWNVHSFSTAKADMSTVYYVLMEKEVDMEEV